MAVVYREPSIETSVTIYCHNAIEFVHLLVAFDSHCTHAYAYGMFESSLAVAILEKKRQNRHSRKQILTAQEKHFRQLLKHAWHHSSFYRELYQEHGITEEDLPTIALADLPFTTKELLMEHFDRVVTDKRLKKKNLVKFIEDEPDPRKLYLNEYIVANTSGTSGNVGVFIYDRRAWSTIRASAVVRVSKPEIRLGKRSKLAFYGATNGRFGGISLVKNAPKLLYDVQFFSLLSPTSEVVKELNAFQPDQLSGYASAVSQLAEEALEGRLKINPKRIVVSGDPLTTKMERRIEKAWSVPLMNYYATTEAICIAARLHGDKHMSVFDDTHIVELLNDSYAREVAIGKPGHIVITSLYNYSFPLIRYKLGDLAIKGTPVPYSQFGSIAKIIGRVNDNLPITLDSGEEDILHPIMLAGFYTPGMNKVQFISHSPKKIEIKYMAKSSIDKAIRAEFMKLLQAKGATKQTKLGLKRVDALPNDTKTGKFRLVIKA